MEKTILYQNKNIFYRSFGNGDPVLFVHGFGEDGEVWNHQVEFLKDKYHLLVPDLPGSGRSELIGDMSMEGMAEVLHSILHEEIPPETDPKEGLANTQIHPNENTSQKINYESFESSRNPPSGGGGATVIGHSMGGYITLALVEKYWNHVNAFGLFHSSAFADTEEKKGTRRKGIGFIKENGPYKFLETAIPGLYWQKNRDEKPALIEEHLAA